MSFSSLAAEIRIKIFRYLLPTDEDFAPKSLGAQRRVRGLSSILRVDQACHLEATPFLYSENRFRFDSTFAMVTFLRRVRAHNCSLITDLRIFSFTWNSNGRLPPGFTPDNAIWDVAAWMAQICPSLSYISFGWVNVHGGDKRYYKIDLSLIKWQRILRHFPLLQAYHSRVEYIPGSNIRSLMLTNKPMSQWDANMVSSLMAVYRFDIQC